MKGAKRIHRPYGHICIFILIIGLTVANSFLLTASSDTAIRLLLASLMTAVITIVSANYAKLVNVIDGYIHRNSVDVKFSISKSTYGDVFAFALLLFAVQYFFRTIVASLYWSMYETPMFICLKACTNLTYRVYSFGNRVYVPVDNSTYFPLHQTIAGMINLFFLWPTFFLFGVIFGGFMQLRASRAIWKRLSATFGLAVMFALSVELLAVSAYILSGRAYAVSFQTEKAFLTHAFLYDFSSIGMGLLVSMIVFRFLRSSDLSRLRVLLSFIPSRDRQETVQLLEGLIAQEKLGLATEPSLTSAPLGKPIQ